MSPIFVPSPNGHLDLNGLRLVFDGIPVDPAFQTTVLIGITKLANAVGLTIDNLDLTATSPGTYTLYAGDGVTNTKAPEPNFTLQIAYAASDHAYFFTSDPDNVVSHEFAHILGLADRYYNGYFHKPTTVGSRVTVPMDQNLFLSEPDYNPAANLMSRLISSWTLTASQVQSIRLGQPETQKPNRVVGLFVDSPQPPAASWTLPPSAYLNNGKLYKVDPPGDDLPLAGYTMFMGVVFEGRAGEALPGNEQARKLWTLRSWTNAAGQSTARLIRGGKVFKRKRLIADGPRIHREMMKSIAAL